MDMLQHSDKRYLVTFFLLPFLGGCSWFFGKTITEQDLKRSKEMIKYEVGEDLAAVVRKLNRDGEAVVMGKYEGNPVYVQIFEEGGNIIVRSYDVNEYNFGRFDIFEGE